MIEQHNKINNKSEVEFNKIINQPQSLFTKTYVLEQSNRISRITSINEACQ